MSKSKERKQKELERRYDKIGYFGFLRLKEVYDFTLWLQSWRGFHLHVTEGRELAVCYIDGRYIRIWYDEQTGVCLNRFGMGMCLAWQGLVVERKRWRQEADND